MTDTTAHVKLTSRVTLHNEDLRSLPVGGAAVCKLAWQCALHKNVLPPHKLSSLFSSFSSFLSLESFADNSIEGTAVPFQNVCQLLQ